MSAPTFHELSITSVRPLGDSAVGLTFAIPASLKAAFHFSSGQYVTLRASIEGQDTRRSYSISSYHGDNSIEVGVKRVPNGLFSNFAAELKPGDSLQVMTPQGRFTTDIGTGAHTKNHHYLLVAAGSGITPCISITRAVLRDEPQSEITLLYGNKRTSSALFKDDLLALKDQYTERFSLLHVLSQESNDVALLSGRINEATITTLIKKQLLQLESLDKAFICGPQGMIEEVSATLEQAGMGKDNILFELFTSATANKKHVAQKTTANTQSVEATGAQVEIILDSVTRHLQVAGDSETVLQAAARTGLELPFSCSAGMCCTCRCKVLSGKACMDANYSLQAWEVEAGYTLACQARPQSEKLVLDFDAT